MMGRYRHCLERHHLAENSVGSLDLEAATRGARPSMGHNSLTMVMDMLVEHVRCREVDSICDVAIQDTVSVVIRN